ncbi:hypothetical protein PIB30_022171 [Stylosanthes scabra]|uniref:Uncharacterized protein n=1 Tax=Stylosanthes scabra TaxID=79078 RepID=A0ABU6WC46_9FABA|nr:hypothetical protein [Stylosanthes scabra]
MEGSDIIPCPPHASINAPAPMDHVVDVNASKQAWSLIVGVVRLYEMPNQYNLADINSIEMVLQDEAVHCLIYFKSCTLVFLTELGMGLSLKAFSFALSPFRKDPRYWSKLTSGVGMAVESAVNNLVLKELVEPAVTRPTARIPFVTLVNPCHRALTLASRGVQIAVTDLTPFLPIQPYGGLAAKGDRIHCTVPNKSIAVYTLQEKPPLATLLKRAEKE